MRGFIVGAVAGLALSGGALANDVIFSVTGEVEGVDLIAEFAFDLDSGQFTSATAYYQGVEYEGDASLSGLSFLYEVTDYDNDGTNEVFAEMTLAFEAMGGGPALTLYGQAEFLSSLPWAAGDVNDLATFALGAYDISTGFMELVSGGESTFGDFGSFTITVVPLPTPGLMAAAGLGVLAGAARPRRRG